MSVYHSTRKLTFDDRRPTRAGNIPKVKYVLLFYNIKYVEYYFNLFWDAVGTFGVRSKAALATGEYSKLVLTARGRDGSRVGWSVAAVCLPVVAAVVVSRPSQPFTLVKQQPVPTGLQGQSPVGTFVELITIILLRVELETLGLGTSHVSYELACWWSLALRRRGRQSRGRRWSRSWVR